MNALATPPKHRRIERGFASHDYLTSHEALRRASDQRERVVDWFEESELLNFESVLPSLLSVGCGGGEIDLTIIRELERRGRAFTYDAVDPSGVALERFRERCSGEDAALAHRVWLHEGKFEDFEPGHCYDLIHFVHVVYGLDDLGPSLNKAYRLLNDGGRMGIVCSTDEGINAFKRAAFSKARLPGRSGRVNDDKLLDVLAELESADLRFEIIPSEIDVTACLEETEHGDQLMSFFLQTDFSQMTADERSELLKVLADCSASGQDGRRILHQPMLGVRVEKRKPSMPQRVALTLRERLGIGSFADVACFA